MKNQVTNPYLPLYEYVPDGEPRVFGDRLYIFGSHDRFKGEFYCVNDYVCWSTPVNDLSQWRFDGYIYHKEEDPYVQKGPKSPLLKTINKVCLRQMSYKVQMVDIICIMA